MAMPTAIHGSHKISPIIFIIRPTNPHEFTMSHMILELNLTATQTNLTFTKEEGCFMKINCRVVQAKVRDTALLFLNLNDSSDISAKITSEVISSQLQPFTACSAYTPTVTVFNWKGWQFSAVV